MNKTDFYSEIYKRYGPVTRARGYFLYTKKGVRLTDLYQENGRAILGWDGKSAFTHLKNVLSRGQTGSFITEEQSHPGRLSRAVSSLTQAQRTAFAFSDKMIALKAGLYFSPQGTSFYRPWSQNQKISDADCAIIIPPLPWTDTIYLLAVKNEALQSKSQEKNCPGSVKLPFALECALTRAIYNLIAELPARQEKNWFVYDNVLTKYWERQGPYLRPKIPQEKYDDFVCRCLDAGLVINPEFNGDSIVPFGADKGVFTKLKNLQFDCQTR